MNEVINKPKGAGRPSVPPQLKRVKMTGIRIQQWVLDWLMSQPGSKGQLIEKLLIEKYTLCRKKK